MARLVGLNLYTGTLTDDATGRVDLDAGGALYAAGAGQTPDDDTAPCDATTGTSMLVVLAPSAIVLHTHPPDAGSARNAWPGVVAGMEMLTDRVRVAVDGRPSALVDVTPAAVAELRLVPSTPVWLSAKATEVTAYPDLARA